MHNASLTDGRVRGAGRRLGTRNDGLMGQRWRWGSRVRWGDGARVGGRGVFVAVVGLCVDGEAPDGCGGIVGVASDHRGPAPFLLQWLDEAVLIR